MSQFYISNDNDYDVWRCKQSQRDRIPITITGVTVEKHIKQFMGIVESVENDAKLAPGKRWRVTILD
jgi:hypothetical protein